MHLIYYDINFVDFPTQKLLWWQAVSTTYETTQWPTPAFTVEI